MQLQSVGEFVGSYPWLFILVAIVILVVVASFFALRSPTGNGSSCYIASGFSCKSISLMDNGTGSVLNISMTDNLGATIALSGNAIEAYIQFSNSTRLGTCVPGTVANGKTFMCEIDMYNYSPQYGTAVSPRFNLHYSVCENGCKQRSSGYVASGIASIITGLPVQQP